MDSFAEETARTYTAILASYREKAVRLQLLALQPDVDRDYFMSAADEVAALGRQLGDLRLILASRGVEPPVPGSTSPQKRA